MVEPQIKQKIKIEEVDPLGEEDRARARWLLVEKLCPDASLFVRWPWVGTWLGVYGRALQPRILIGHERGCPMGAVLICQRLLWRHSLPIRQLHLGTGGEPDEDSACVEFNELLCEKTSRAAFAQAVMRHLRRRMRWDELLFPGFVPEHIASWPQLFCLRGEERWYPSHAMDLDLLRSEGRSVDQALSKNSREQAHQSLRFYGGKEALVLEEAATQEQRLQFLDELSALHQASWTARGENGAFRSPLFLRFHRSLVAAYPEHVQLLRLKDAKGDVLGLSYNLLDPDHGTVYFYQAGLRLPTRSKDRPGLCLHVLAMEHNLHEGRSRYDFMAGAARYKHSLSNSRRELCWLTLQRPHLHILVERAARKLWQTTKPLVARAGLYKSV